MGNDQYAPTGALHKAEIMLFTHFHAQYPLKEKEGIIDGLLMALDLDFIRQVIYIKSWEGWTSFKGPCVLQCI